MQSSNELRDIISGWIDGSISSIHTALPGKIIDYDASICQASVQPVGKFKIQTAVCWFSRSPSWTTS